MSSALAGSVDVSGRERGVGNVEEGNILRDSFGDFKEVEEILFLWKILGGATADEIIRSETR